MEFDKKVKAKMQIHLVQMKLMTDTSHMINMIKNNKESFESSPLESKRIMVGTHLKAADKVQKIYF